MPALGSHCEIHAALQVQKIRGGLFRETSQPAVPRFGAPKKGLELVAMRRVLYRALETGKGFPQPADNVSLLDASRAYGFARRLINYWTD